MGTGAHYNIKEVGKSVLYLYPWCSIAHKGDLPLRSMHANQNLANLKKIKMARNMDITHSAGPKYMKEE